MPEVDKAEQILRPLADAGNRQAAHDAWDVYENSKSKDEFISSINKIDLPDEYKQKLYDSKWPAPAAPPRSIPMKAGESYIAPKGPPTFKEGMYDFYNRAKDAIGLGPKKDPTLAAIDKNRVDPLDKPLIPIASFANQNPKTMGEGFMTGVMEGGEGITSPKNLALMFGMKGLAKAPGIAWQGISKASNAVFKTDMAKGIIDMIPEAKAALDAGDEALAGRLAGHMAVNLLFLTEDKVREKYGDIGVKIKKRLNKDIPSQVKTEAPPVKAKTAPPAKAIDAPKVEIAPAEQIAPVAPEVAPPAQVTEPVKMDPENAKSLLPEGFTLSRGKRPPNGVNASYPEGMTLDEISGKLDTLVQSGAIKDWEVVGNKVRLNFNKETDGQRADQELVKSLEEPKHKFASTQVQLPKEIGDKLVEFGKSIPDEDLAEDGRETDPHITVKYGINSDNPKDIEKLKTELSKMPPIEVYLGKTSIFPANENRASDVVKADVYSTGLHELNKIVSSSVPTTDTYQGYTPHATIAYVKPGLGEKYSGSDTLSGSKAIIDNVEFRDRNENKVVIPLSGTAKKELINPAEKPVEAPALVSLPSPPKPKSVAPPAPIKPQKVQTSRGLKYIDQFGDKQWLSDLKNGMAYLVDELGSLTVVPESELSKMQQVPETPPSVSEPLKKKMSSVDGLNDIDLKSTNPANVIDGLRYRVYTGDKEKPSRVYLNNAALSLLAAFNGTPDADYLAGLHVTKDGVESIIDTARYNAKLHTGNERSRLYGLADALEKANGDKGLVVAYAGLKGDTKTVVRHELSHSLQRDMPAIFTDDFASKVSTRSPHWLDVAMHYVGNYSRREIIPELLADWNTGNYDLFKGETHSIDKQAVDEIVLDIVEELIKEYGAEQVEKSFKFAASGQREKASVAKIGGDGKNTKPPAKLSESARSTGGSIPGRR